MNWVDLQKEQELIQVQLRNDERLCEQQRLLKYQIAFSSDEMYTHRLSLDTLRIKLHKLDGISFMNMIRTWTGQQDVLREEEIDKAAILELKMNEAKKMVEDLSEDFKTVTRKRKVIDVPRLESALQDVKIKKKAWLQLHQPEKANRLDQLTDEIILSKQLIQEIKEAEEAGIRALTALGKTSTSLHSADGYSTWDTFFGGGLLATHLKHSALDSTESQLHSAQIALQRFRNELLDVQNISTKTLRVETDGFVKFADYFFDDIFSAWSVHSKIATAKEQVSGVQEDVHTTLRQLQDKNKQAEVHIQSLEDEKAKILSA
ncbi:MAG: hypothetical protein RR595_12500 [Lysinibacillus sp.]